MNSLLQKSYNTNASNSEKYIFFLREKCITVCKNCSLFYQEMFKLLLGLTAAETIPKSFLDSFMKTNPSYSSFNKFLIDSGTNPKNEI